MAGILVRFKIISNEEIYSIRGNFIYLLPEDLRDSENIKDTRILLDKGYEGSYLSERVILFMQLSSSEYVTLNLR